MVVLSTAGEAEAQEGLCPWPRGDALGTVPPIWSVPCSSPFTLTSSLHWQRPAPHATAPPPETQARLLEGQRAFTHPLDGHPHRAERDPHLGTLGIMGSERACEASAALRVGLLQRLNHPGSGPTSCCAQRRVLGRPRGFPLHRTGCGAGLAPSSLPCVCLFCVEPETLMRESLSFQEITHPMGSFEN